MRVANNDHPTWPDAPGTDNNQTQGMEDGTVKESEPSLEEALAIVTGERDDYLDQLQRSRAEFVNFRRRNDQERAQLRNFVVRDVTAQFLPVLDDFERAMSLAPANPQDAGFLEGVELIQTKLMGVVDRLGVSKIDALGQPFDPAVHEAVATEPNTTGSTVVEVYQNGYRIGDTLVRPAMVKTGDPLETGDDDDAVSFSA